MNKNKINVNRICFLYPTDDVDGNTKEESICIDMDYVPNVGERITIKQIGQVDYCNLRLLV